MSQPRDIGSWGVSALQGHSDPRGLGMVPTAAWSIPCWSPCHWQGCKLRDFLRHHHPERKLIRFHFHQKWLFNISSLSLGPKQKKKFLSFFFRNSDLVLHPAGCCRAAALLAQQAALGSFPY